MTLRLPLLLAPLLLALAGGCAVGLGQDCTAEAACPEGLVCTYPTVGGSPAAQGLCDYPLRLEGEPCTTASECEGALTCSNHFTPNDRYGTCEARRADGEACAVGRDCKSGSCTGASGQAADGTCTPKK